jgi:dipeptide/tripeptide permease
MNARALAALALLLVALGLERLGYYGSRSFLSLELVRSGEAASALGRLYSELRLISIVGIGLGGVVALGVGPRATAAIGALLAAGGHLALAAGAPLLVGAGLIAFGSGVLRPCPVAAAAELLAWDERGPARPGPHRFTAVAAFAVLGYAAINLGSLLGPVIGGLLRKSAGPALVYGVWAGALVTAALACAVAAALGPSRDDAGNPRPEQGPYRAPEPAPPTPAPNAAMALAGLALLVVPEAVSILGTAVSEPPSSLFSGPNIAWLFSVNPAVVVLGSVVVAGLLLAAALQRSTLPPLLLYGVGLALFAVGLGITALTGVGGAFVFALGEAVRGLGEAAMFGVPLAYAAIAVRGRAATLVVAGWFTVSALVSLVANLLGGFESLHLPLLALCAFAGLAMGAALLALGKKIHLTFFDPPAPGLEVS